MPNVALMESILAAVKQEAVKIDECMRDELDRLAPDIDELLVEILSYGLFNGGKRIRPLLVIVGSRLCGRNDDDAYRLAVAFEYLHAATLFHDDIIDQSATRRGKPAVHQKFGNIAAILAGDYLHALSMATVGRFSGQEGLQVFCRATTGMVDGEFMQLRNARNHNLSERDYYEAVMGKTGLLISAACEVGALYGRGNTQQISALREYGVQLGCAYQIIDDLLDYQGDTAKTGKLVGNDLAEGKMTLPLILALEKADSADRRRLMEIMAAAEQRSLYLEEVSNIIVKYRGFAEARKKAEDAVDEAVARLAVFTEKDVLPARGLLEGLARYVLLRQK